MESTGVYTAQKKDGSIYYRVSITYKSKHISLGSYNSKQLASKVYKEASDVLNNPQKHTIIAATESINYNDNLVLPIDKWVSLINFRDNNIYIKTPIYLLKKYFLYILDSNNVLKFNVDDLFYYSNHRILTRKGYMYVNDYGSQINILSRYGIKDYAVLGRDYTFANEDPTDFRYGNVRIKNRYNGVFAIINANKTNYRTIIHIKGNVIVGTYKTEKEAAVAYNKAINILKDNGINKNYNTNYIEDISPIEYATLYNTIKVSKRIRHYNKTIKTDM